MDGRRLTVTLVMAGAALVAVALHAAAAPLDPTLALNTTFPSGPLTPFVESEGFPPLQDVLVRFPMRVDLTVPAGHVSSGATRVALSVAQEPFWIVVGFQPEIVTFEVSQGPQLATQTYSQTVEVVMHARNTAPAATQGNVELTATAFGPGDLQPVATAPPVQGIVFATPYVLFEAAAERTMLQLDRFGETNVSINVINLGNALVAATVDVAYADAGLEATGPRMPQALKANPMGFQKEKEAGDILVTIRHRSGTGGEVLLLVTAALPQDGWLVKEQAVRLHVDVAKTGGPSAALPLLALGAVAGAVFLFRRP